MIDLCAHLLHGQPGGPPDLESAVAMARAVAHAGTTTVVATAQLALPNPALLDHADHAREELVQALAAEHIALEVLPGAVLSVAAMEGLDDDDLQRATLGEGGRWLLLSLPDAGWSLSLPTRMAALEMQGLGVVLAHVEQCDSVQINPDRLRDLIGRGALVQVDAASFAGWNGARSERSAYGLMRAGIPTFLASGARWDSSFPQGMNEGLDAVEAVLRRPRHEVLWMVDAGPRMVIAGQPVRAPRLVPVPRGGFDAA